MYNKTWACPPAVGSIQRCREHCLGYKNCLMISTIAEVMDISDIEETLEIKIEDCSAETFSGFVLGLYGSIPEDGSSFELSTDLFDIDVLEINEHRIEKATVIVKQPLTEEEEAETPAAVEK
jgi:CBS domain containing-hemolysin-like protein